MNKVISIPICKFIITVIDLFVAWLRADWLFCWLVLENVGLFNTEIVLCKQLYAFKKLMIVIIYKQS